MANSYTHSLYDMLEAGEAVEKGKYIVRIPKFSSSHSNMLQKTINEMRNNQITNNKNDLLDSNYENNKIGFESSNVNADIGMLDSTGGNIINNNNNNTNGNTNDHYLDNVDIDIQVEVENN